MSSEECFEETALLKPEGLDRRGRCGLVKSRQPWLAMSGSGEWVWGQPGRTRGVGTGTWGRGAVASGRAHAPASEAWRCP